MRRLTGLRDSVTALESPTIQSLGPPPERHADRIVAEMLRHLAQQRAALFPAIAAALVQSSDGGPRAQRRMQERVERAGAIASHLTPGKRGCYELVFYDLAGWDVGRHAEITTTDPLPDKPWIVCHVNLFTSPGRGREQRDFRSHPLLFVTHHALSRAAQRFGATHSRHLIAATEHILVATLKLSNELGSMERWLAPPPVGHRVPVAADATVVLKRHKTREALIAATIFSASQDERLG
jgi:hypothetical protein